MRYNCGCHADNRSSSDDGSLLRKKRRIHVKLDEAKTVIMAVTLLVILAAIGVLILQELQGTMKSSTTINNQTLSGLTSGTPYTIVTGTDDFPADLSASVTNETSGGTYAQNDTQWYVNSTYGTIVILDTAVVSDPIEAAGPDVVATTGYNVTYSYSHGNTKTDTITNATLGISNLTKQLPTLGIIFGGLLIIGAVFLMALYFGKKSGYA